MPSQAKWAITLGLFRVKGSPLVAHGGASFPTPTAQVTSSFLWGPSPVGVWRGPGQKGQWQLQLGGP